MSRTDSTILAPRNGAPRRRPARAGRTEAGRSERGQPIALRSADEIVSLRAAGVVVAEALAATRKACVVGATTADVDDAAMAVIRSAGAEPLFLGYPSSSGAKPFPAATCISVNEEIVHGIPGARVLRDGDLVSIDCGVRLNGWCSDSAITVPVGSVSAASLALLGVAESMLATAIRMAAPGVAWSDIAESMQDIALAGGHGIVVEYVGHGIGRSLHESPQLPNCLNRALVEHGDFTLRPGMVLAIEPMITLRGLTARPTRSGAPSGESLLLDADGFPLGVATRTLADGWTVVAEDGSPAVHVEHTVAITHRGCEVLSVPAGTSLGTDPRCVPGASPSSSA